jgi:hypothetical protein
MFSEHEVLKVVVMATPLTATLFTPVDINLEQVVDFLNFYACTTQKSISIVFCVSAIRHDSCHSASTVNRSSHSKTSCAIALNKDNTVNVGSNYTSVHSNFCHHQLQPYNSVCCLPRVAPPPPPPPPPPRL